MRSWRGAICVLRTGVQFFGKDNVIMSAADIVAELETLGSEATRKTLLRHGVSEPVFGVKVADLQKIRKRIKVDYQLALDLYETGIYDARYLAGLIADDSRMTKRDLQRWAKQGTCGSLCGYTVPWVASESRYGWEMGLKWIEARQPHIAVIGWSTLSSLVAIKADEDLDLAALKALLQRVEREIHDAPNRVRYAMNGFVISLGTYVTSLSKAAIAAGKRIGVVDVDVGDTSCKVPFAPDYINKVVKRGTVGKKRKTAKC